MHPPQPSPVTSTSQPSLPPLPSTILPPLPPGPPPPSKPTVASAHLNHSNGFIDKPGLLQISGRNQDCYGVELSYPSSYEFQFVHHPQPPDPFFPFFPPISVPPPVFSITQPHFTFPPPIKQPPPTFHQPLKLGFPFPPPGYDTVRVIHKKALNHEATPSQQSKVSSSSSHSRRSKSKSPKRSSKSRSTRFSSLRRRSRSRSPRGNRSQSRSISHRPVSCFSERRRRSRSQSPKSSSRALKTRTDSQTSNHRVSSCHKRKKSRSRSRGRNLPRSDQVFERSQSRSCRSNRSRSKSPLRLSSSIRRADSSKSNSPSKRESEFKGRNKHSSRQNDLKKRRSRSSSRLTSKTSSTSPNRRSSSYSGTRGVSKCDKPSRTVHSTSKHHSSGRIDLHRSSTSSISQPKEENSVPEKKKQGTEKANECAKDEDCDIQNLEHQNVAGNKKTSIPGRTKNELHTVSSRMDLKNTRISAKADAKPEPKSERESLVERWRLNNCKNLEEVANKLDVLSKMEADEIIELEKQTWTRSAPADLYYKRSLLQPHLMEGTQKLLELCEKFEFQLVQRAERERQKFPAHQPAQRDAKFKMCRHADKSSSSSSSSSCEDSSSDEEDKALLELDRKRKHPQRLHPELWHNEAGEMNDGPLCRCSHRARRSGIRHNVYVGEQKLEKCNINTNNAGKLHHYRITMSPPVNFLTKTPTIIEHDSHEYIFEGFSMLSHFPLVKLPTCKVIRFNIEYTILYVDEAMPENFTIRELDLFYNYLFHEVLELLDLDLRAFGDPNGCNQFHFMPRFVRDLPENGKEILSMNEVLKYLLKSNKPLVPEDQLNEIYNMSLYDWQTFADEVKCMVVTKPGMKPCSLRVDQLDRETMDEGRFPEIVHFGIRPPQLSYAGNTEYQKHWKEYVKFRHLLANMPKPSAEDKCKLMGKEVRLQEMRTVSKMKRDVTIALSSEGFYRTGIMCDIIQHALLLPVLVCHLRFHKSLDQLEEDMDYKFKNRYLLQLALTHPSYRENFGTNPDHARNSLTNCGIRQPEYGDRRIHYMNTRKRGINTLIQIMSRFGKKEATESNIGHNERLEFLGDAVVEFITSIHLFHLFPDLEEGGLATYRAAIVQNQHLAVMARRLNLDSYMLYAHGSDLCHDLELRHAMANCFEALMGALFLDGGIEIADKVFGCTLWKGESTLTEGWMNYPLHPLQEQEPAGDRQWIGHFPVLQKLTEFEERIGITFKHIRLLARAFTDRSVGYTNLTLGSNQRLEFLGDTVLQIIASEYLYKFFPEHHEGHLSLLRSSLVNNRTQAVVCDDLGMTEFALYANPKHEIKTKDRADLLEAFLGALYIDKGLKHCHLFCEVCFFPRLQDFIMNQDWNDPKSKLQQCCLTLRTMEGGEPDIPVYKVIQCMGPTNTRIYTVAVYFRGERLAQASGHSIQQAEMNAANEALELSTELFPQLDHQRRVIAKSLKKQKKRARREAALKAARGIIAEEEKNRTRERNRRSHEHRERRSHHRTDKGRSRSDEKARERDRDRYRVRNHKRKRSRSRESKMDTVLESKRATERNRSKSRDRGLEMEKAKHRQREKEIAKDRGREKDRSSDGQRNRERDQGDGRRQGRENNRGSLHGFEKDRICHRDGRRSRDSDRNHERHERKRCDYNGTTYTTSLDKDHFSKGNKSGETNYVEVTQQEKQDDDNSPKVDEGASNFGIEYLDEGVESFLSPRKYSDLSCDSDAPSSSSLVISRLTPTYPNTPSVSESRCSSRSSSCSSKGRIYNSSISDSEDTQYEEDDYEMKISFLELQNDVGSTSEFSEQEECRQSQDIAEVSDFDTNQENDKTSDEEASNI